MLAGEVSKDDLLALRDGFTSENYETRIARTAAGASEWLVLVDRDHPKGWLVIEWHGKSSRPNHPDISDLYVRDGCRGSGLGSALLLEAERRARARGQRSVGLSVNPVENHDARRLYERLGYRHDGGEPYLDGVYDGSRTGSSIS